MKVKYSDGVADVLLDEVGEVKRGETVEVSAELGKQLLEQGWEKVGGRKATPKKKATPKVASDGEKPENAAAAGDITKKEND
jgi:hypothetical protein